MAARPISRTRAELSAGAFFGLMAHGAGQETPPTGHRHPAAPLPDRRKTHRTVPRTRPAPPAGSRLASAIVQPVTRPSCACGSTVCSRAKNHIEPHGGGHHPKAAQGHPAAGKRWYPEHDAHDGAQPGNAQQKSQGLPVRTVGVGCGLPALRLKAARSTRPEQPPARHRSAPRYCTITTGMPTTTAGISTRFTNAMMPASRSNSGRL